MPVSVAVSIMMTTTFVTSILAYLLQGEPVTMAELGTIFGGFLGVIVLMNPTVFEGDIPSVLAR